MRSGTSTDGESAESGARHSRGFDSTRARVSVGSPPGGQPRRRARSHPPDRRSSGTRPSLRRIYGWFRRVARSPCCTSARARAILPTAATNSGSNSSTPSTTPPGATIGDRVARMSHQPLISVIMPVYNPPPDLLRAAIDSVRAQLYPNWELCIADDCSTEAHVAAILAEYEAKRPRIKVTGARPTGTSRPPRNSALSWRPGMGRLSRSRRRPGRARAGPGGTGHRRSPDAGIVYSDEDKLDAAGDRQDSRTSSPTSTRCCCWARTTSATCCLFRRDLVTEVGGYRRGLRGEPGLGPRPAGLRAARARPGGPHPARPVPLAGARGLDGVGACRPSRTRSTPVGGRSWTTSTGRAGGPR